ncbi:MAG TPA: glutamate cyclase domain-containing protein [Gemmataceae bacterium]|nr:glutamate cyclase domain-containing protein [Gemmataceae bacterium]
MTSPLTAIRDLIQEDVGNRGLRTDPAADLITACPDDFANACRGIAQAPQAAVAIVTGFYIPHATPPCGETDGPLGALFLARALVPLGIRVALVTDAFSTRPLQVGLAACGLERDVTLLTNPPLAHPWETYLRLDWLRFARDVFRMTHLIALERVGPSHTPETIRAQDTTGQIEREFLRKVPEEDWDRCHTMRGLDITAQMSPAHLLFEAVKAEAPLVTTIGIGDGGNEIGMGKIPWDVIRRNIPGGARVACRVATEELIVCGVSNWGAYGLAAGVRLLRGMAPEELFEVERERVLLERMVEGGPLVDGVTGQQTATVDGLTFERYAEPLRRLATIR